MSKSALPDPFQDARNTKGFGTVNDQDDPVTMVLGLKDVRKCAHNWKTFQSGGEEVGRIVVPSEQAIRDTRQIPFEVDPPQHGDYRALVEPWFKRPLEDEYKARLATIIDELLDEVLAMDSVEVVEEFSLKLQSRALTLLLNIPYQEAGSLDWLGHSCV